MFKSFVKVNNQFRNWLFSVLGLPEKMWDFEFFISQNDSIIVRSSIYNFSEEHHYSRKNRAVFLNLS